MGEGGEGVEGGGEGRKAVARRLGRGKRRGARGEGCWGILLKLNWKDNPTLVVRQAGPRLLWLKLQNWLQSLGEPVIQ